MLYGAPLKVVWLRIGNCMTVNANRLITAHADEIRALGADPLEALLVLS